MRELHHRADWPNRPFFGNHGIFSFKCYHGCEIQQKSVKEFVYMSPVDRRSLLIQVVYNTCLICLSNVCYRPPVVGIIHFDQPHAMDLWVVLLKRCLHICKYVFGWMGWMKQGMLIEFFCHYRIILLTKSCRQYITDSRKAHAINAWPGLLVHDYIHLLWTFMPYIKWTRGI